MPSTSRWVSDFPPEMWRLVADQIADLRSLRALICTCRTFKNLFLPALHRDRTVLLHDKRPWEFLQEALPAGIGYTRSLEIWLGDFEDEEGYDESFNKGYVSYISALVRAMPLLNSLVWEDRSIDEFGPSQILHDRELLSTLKKCSALRHLYLAFPGIYRDTASVGAYSCSAKLNGFSNLTSLELYNLYGQDETLIRNISTPLKACQKLKKLGLGRAELWSAVVPALVIDYELGFLEQLCLEYCSKNTRPLKLDTLRLGEAIFLSESSNKENYLAKLVDLSSLRSLHIWNGLLVKDLFTSEAKPVEIDWSLLDGCTSLHQLEVYMLEGDVRRWLNKHGKTVQELVIMSEMETYERDMRNFDKLSLPNLTMLFMMEMPSAIKVLQLEDDSSDSETESQTVNSPFSKVQLSAKDHSNDEETDLAEEDDVVEVEDFETKSGNGMNRLERRVDISIRTVLDRLHDHGSCLTRLSVNLDLDTQWGQFSTHLPKLKNWAQFRVDRRERCSGLYPGKHCSLWPTIINPKEIARRYTKLMRWKCPSLQYVRFGDWAWQITVPWDFDGESVSEREVFARIQLRELSWEEMMSIYLFSIDDERYLSGLSCPTRLTEEERKRNEEWRTECTIRETLGSSSGQGGNVRREFRGRF